MSFYKTYDLKQLVSEQDAKTFRAIQHSTGRIVLLHLFDAKGHPVLTEIKKKLGGGPGARPVQPLLEVGEFAGGHYVVTELIEPFPGLREWVARVPNPTASTTAVAPPPAYESRPLDPASAPLPARNHSAPMPNPAVYGDLGTSPAGTPPPLAPSRSGNETGEFTRKFGLKRNAEPSPRQESLSDESAVIWRLFGMRTGSRTLNNATRETEDSGRPPDHSPTSTSGAADEDRWPASRDDSGYWGGKLPSGQEADIEEEQRRAAQSSLPVKPPFQGPSDFNKGFGPQPRIIRPSLRTTPMRSGLDSSDLLGKPSSAEKPSGGGLGDYTRVVAGPARSVSAGRPPDRSAAPAATQRAKGRFTAWLAIGIPALLVVLALVVIMAIGSR